MEGDDLDNWSIESLENIVEKFKEKNPLLSEPSEEEEEDADFDPLRIPTDTNLKPTEVERSEEINVPLDKEITLTNKTQYEEPEDIEYNEAEENNHVYEESQNDNSGLEDLLSSSLNTWTSLDQVIQTPIMANNVELLKANFNILISEYLLH